MPQQMAISADIYYKKGFLVQNHYISKSLLIHICCCINVKRQYNITYTIPHYSVTHISYDDFDQFNNAFATVTME